MANNFGKGIKVTSGFDLSAKTPLDNRTVVDTIAERNAHVTNNRAYPGLKVFVNSDKKEYMYDGNSWIESGGITDIQLEQLTAAYAYSMSDHVSAESIEINFDNINNKIKNFLTSDEIQELVDTKSDANHDHNNDYYSKYEVDKKIVDAMTDGQVDLSGYATIKDLSTKADASHDHTPSDVMGLNDILDQKADIEDVATKEELAEKADVNHGHEISEITNLQSTLDLKANITSVYNRTELNTIFAEMDEAIASKSDWNHDHNNDYYLKSEIDKKITDAVTDGQVDLSNYATLSDLSTKADANHDHTPSDIMGLNDLLDTKANIADVATKEELATKSDSGHIHDLSEITNLQSELNSKADLENTYNKTEINDKLQIIEQNVNSKSDDNHDHNDSYYLKSEVDEAIAKVATDGEVNLQGYATKLELSQALSEKANADHDHTPSDITGLNDLLEEISSNTYDKSEIDEIIVAAKSDAMTYSDELITNLIDSAPEAMDTLNELAKAITDNKEIYDAYVKTVTEQLSSKADENHDHNNDYYTKEQVTELINSGISGVDLSNLATKSELTTGLGGKSDINHGHEISEINNLQNELNNKINKDEAATKEDIANINSQLGDKSDMNHDHDDAYANKIHNHVADEITDLSEKYYDKVAMDAALSGKADDNHDHNNDYYLKHEVDNKIEAGITDANLSQYATVNFVMTELSTKADAEHDHTVSDIIGLKETLDAKADKDTVVTKDELVNYSPVEHDHDDRYCTPQQVDNKIAAIDHSQYATKAEVEEALETKSDENHDHNDIYYTKEAVDQRIESGIDSVDLSGLATKAELEQGLSTKADENHDHDYAEKTHVHVTGEITDLYDNVYKKQEVDIALTGKADDNHDHDDVYSKLNHGHDLSDLSGLGDSYYDKDQVDELLSSKSDSNHDHDEYANKEHKHTTGDVTDLFDRVYNKGEVDIALMNKADNNHGHDDEYSKLNHNHTTDEITDLFDKVYNKDEMDTALTGKADDNHSHDDEYSKLDHAHTVDKITDLFDNVYTKGEIDAALTGKADDNHSHDDEYSKINHGHVTDEITDLFDKVYDKKEMDFALRSKADENHSHDDEYSKLDHTHTVDKITDLFDNVYNKDEIDASLSNMAPSEHDHDDVYSKLNHVHTVDKITDLFDKVYTKDDVDEALSNKSPLNHGHEISEITNLQKELDSKIDASLAATKAELETGLSTKADDNHNHDDDYSKLNHNHTGVYLTVDEINKIVDDAAADAITEAETRAQDYTNGKIAEILGGEGDGGVTTLSGLANTLNEHKQEFEEYKSDMEVALGDKSDIEHAHNDMYYTKEEVNGLIEDNIGDIDFSSFATKEELETKSDVNHDHDDDYSKLGHSHTFSEITGITDGIYSKTEVDELLSGKSDVNHSHSDNYANKTHEHVVSEITNLFDKVYSETEVDEMLDTKSDTNHNHDSRYYLKYQVDAKISGLGIAGYAKLEDLQNWAELFALKNHIHDDYALKVHTHDGMSATVDEDTVNQMLDDLFGTSSGESI